MSRGYAARIDHDRDRARVMRDGGDVVDFDSIAADFGEDPGTEIPLPREHGDCAGRTCTRCLVLGTNGATR